MRVLCLLAAVAVTAISPSFADEWYEHYQRGIGYTENGDGPKALTEIGQALAKRPEPGLRVRTQGISYVDYLPHLYLAIAAHLAGDPEQARRHLARSEAAGVAARSDSGRQLLDAYRILLRAPGEPGRAGGTAAATAEMSAYADYEAKGTVLSDDEVERIREEVLSRCHLDSETTEAPWYYHYELGLELARRDDPQRALDAFIEATQRRPDPAHRARIYGMWFKDYIPYFYIARAHAELGNWECADDALRLSNQFGEVSSDDAQYSELQDLSRKAQESR